MSQRSVCFVTPEIYPGTAGGIGRLVQQVAHALERAGQPAVILFVGEDAALRTFGRYAAAALPATRILGVDALLTDLAPSEDIPGWAFHFAAYHRSYRVAHALRRLAGRSPLAGVEFADYGGLGYVALKWRRLWGEELAGMPMWVRLHGPHEIWSAADDRDDQRIETQQLHAMERYCLRHADGWVGPSAAALDWLAGVYGIERPCWDLPPPFERLGPRCAHPRRLEAGAPLRLLFYGKLQHLKGPDVLIRAAVALAREQAGAVEVDLVGDEVPHSWRHRSYRQELEAVIPPELAPRFRFHGGIEPRALPALAARCTVAVVPSRVETFCLAAHELNWIGIPLVLADLPAFRFFFRDRENCRVFDGTVEGLIRVLREIRGETVPFASWGWEDAVGEPDTAALYTRILAECSPPVRPQERPAGATGRVSVVVPFYEMQDHVDATLASVHASTYPNWEIVIVDDGSRSAPARAKLEALRVRYTDDTRVRILTKPNGGLGSARNHGIAHSTGSYVLPLDSDDLIDPDYLRLAVAALERNPELDAVSSYVGYFDDGCRPEDVCDYVIPYDLLVPALFLENRAGTASSVFRRAVFERHSYDERLFSYEDWDLWWQLAAVGGQVETLPRILFRYRRRADSMVNTIGYSRHTRLVGMMAERHAAVLQRLWPGTFRTYLEELDRLRGVLADRRAEIGRLEAALAGVAPASPHEYSVRAAAGLLLRLLRSRARAAIDAACGRRIVTVRVASGRHPEARGREVWCAGVRPVRDTVWTLDGVVGAPPGWSRRNGGVAPRQQVLLSSTPGATLCFDLGRGGFGLGFLHHPWSGRVELSVDGRTQTIELFAARAAEGFYDHFWTGDRWVGHRVE
jgi:glycosyltransferase involved in cell wall biosynthesis